LLPTNSCVHDCTRPADAPPGSFGPRAKEPLMSRPALPAQPLRDRWRVLLCAVLIGYAMFLSSAQRLQATEPSQQLTTPGVTGTDDSTWRGAASVLLADGLAPFLDVPGTSVTYPTGAAHGPYGVAVSPDGKHVYVSDYGND